METARLVVRIAAVALVVGMIVAVFVFAGIAIFGGQGIP